MVNKKIDKHTLQAKMMPRHKVTVCRPVGDEWKLVEGVFHVRGLHTMREIARAK